MDQLVTSGVVRRSLHTANKNSKLNYSQITTLHNAHPLKSDYAMCLTLLANVVSRIILLIYFVNFTESLFIVDLEVLLFGT